MTYTMSAVDTGERKEMFGFTARHVKSTTVIQSSPDACNPVNQKMEIDGWYIDLNIGLTCQLDRPPMAPPSRETSRPSCKDQTRFRREGSAKTGFPLIETSKMYGPSGQVMFSITKEVIELSREPLDSALFDVPAGYTEAASSQELWHAVDGFDHGRAGQATAKHRKPNDCESSRGKESGIAAHRRGQINTKSGSVSPEARGRLVGRSKARVWCGTA